MSLFLVLACKGKRTEPPAAVPVDAGAGALPARVTAALVKTEAAAFVAGWVEAQNKLDFAAYAALYHPKTFRGIKRTSKGTVKEFDLAAWKDDRARMFKNKFEVAAELIGVATWLDPDSKLKPGMVAIRFVQHWRSEKYADHGVKVLHVWRDSDGKKLITYEDLLNSEPGWDRQAYGIARADLKPPANEEGALALWAKLGPTGADYHLKLASIPDDPAVTRPMALAFFVGGNFKCEDIVSYEECGETNKEWANLDPKAGFDNPCLRRRMVGWALDHLADSDLGRFESEWVAMAGLEAPEAELPDLAQAAAVRAPEAVRLKIWSALMAADREEKIELGTNLSNAGLIAASASGVDKALLALDATQHLTVLAEHVVAERYDVETQRTVLNRIASIKRPEVKEALAALSEHEDCKLAMEAALALEKLGDTTRLPRRRPDMSLDDARYELCLLLYEPNPERQTKRIRQFIDADGFEIVEETDDEWAEPPEERVKRTESRSKDPDDAIKYLREVYEGGWDRASVELEAAEGGPVITTFDFYRFNGCRC